MVEFAVDVFFQWLRFFLALTLLGLIAGGIVAAWHRLNRWLDRRAEERKDLPW